MPEFVVEVSRAEPPVMNGHGELARLLKQRDQHAKLRAARDTLRMVRRQRRAYGNPRSSALAHLLAVSQDAELFGSKCLEVKAPGLSDDAKTKLVREIVEYAGSHEKCTDLQQKT